MNVYEFPAYWWCLVTMSLYIFVRHPHPHQPDACLPPRFLGVTRRWLTAQESNWPVAGRASYQHQQTIFSLSRIKHCEWVWTLENTHTPVYLPLLHACYLGSWLNDWSSLINGSSINFYGYSWPYRLLKHCITAAHNRIPYRLEITAHFFLPCTLLTVRACSIIIDFECAVVRFGILCILYANRGKKILRR